MYSLANKRVNRWQGLFESLPFLSDDTTDKVYFVDRPRGFKKSGIFGWKMLSVRKIIEVDSCFTGGDDVCTGLEFVMTIKKYVPD